MNTQQIIAVLEAEREQLDAAIAALAKIRQHRGKASRKRTMSAEARRKISIAQKKRWAAQKRGSKAA